MSRRIARLRSELEHIKQIRRDQLAKHKRLFDAMTELNKQYAESQISYSKYVERFERLLRNRTAEEVEEEFTKRFRRIDGWEESVNSQISHNELLRKSKAKAVVLSMIVLFAVVSPLAFVDVGDMLTGFATSSTTTISSQANIDYYFAVAKSTNFTQGIAFGTLTIGQDNINATANYNGSSKTGYYLNTSSDANTNTTICVKAGDDFLNGSNRMGIGNMTWNGSQSSTSQLPSFGGKQAMTKDFVNSTANLGIGLTDYYRFWLSVPGDQSPGDYNTTTTFQVVRLGNSCT
tara:strand:- start:540 stop:1409 length:870 start_codon:yes stop_codon:yes gene_type:complete